ncbi:MAG: beta-N-acetylhexosaminidase [Christensenellaceae bacterium]|jgi:hexosaminidase|nr:beta-N-acetylhexosaminidase [Christensenellaceae bacterium]
MVKLIPLPVECTIRSGFFKLPNVVRIYSDSDLCGAKSVLKSILEKIDGVRCEDALDSGSSHVAFCYDRELSNERYILDITENKVIINASGFSGAFYATQTLRQLFESDSQSPLNNIQCAHILDYPRYEWRSIMLDESRHFFGKDVVKQLLDLLAMHKMNVFHWHLSDNEGWRVEIKKYPKLIEIGSKRRGTHFMAWGNRKDSAVDWTPYSGHYTQEEIKEIVQYAAERNIMVVPEIDMPAHFGAVLAAYPELGCRGVKIEVPIMHGGEKNGPADLIACAGNSDTYKFIYDVIDELAELFPAPYFHIGGDEAPKKEWKNCPKCQKVINDNKLKDEEELQGYFNNKIALYLKTKGKRLIGWNEILKSTSIDKDAIAQYWTLFRDKNAERWLVTNGRIIASKHQAFYFDMPYAVRNLKTTYKFEPSQYKIKDPNGGILGVEGTLWTEWISTKERLFFQLFPRLEAISEVAWTPREKRNYADFRSRLKSFIKLLSSMNIRPAPLEIVDTGFLRSVKIGKIFHLNDAHIEYKSALSLNADSETP